MDKRKFKSIQDVLNKLLKNYNLEFSVKKENLFEKWEEIIGKQLYDKCTPVKYEDKILYLKAKNSVWRNELKLRQNDLLSIIEKKTGNNFIKSIRFI